MSGNVCSAFHKGSIAKEAIKERVIDVKITWVSDYRYPISEFGVSAVNLTIACDWERVGIKIHAYMIC